MSGETESECVYGNESARASQLGQNWTYMVWISSGERPVAAEIRNSATDNLRNTSKSCRGGGHGPCP